MRRKVTSSTDCLTAAPQQIAAVPRAQLILRRARGRRRRGRRRGTGSPLRGRRTRSCARTDGRCRCRRAARRAAVPIRRPASDAGTYRCAVRVRPSGVATVRSRGAGRAAGVGRGRRGGRRRGRRGGRRRGRTRVARTATADQQERGQRRTGQPRGGKKFVHAVTFGAVPVKRLGTRAAPRWRRMVGCSRS